MILGLLVMQCVPCQASFFVQLARFFSKFNASFPVTRTRFKANQNFHGFGFQRKQYFSMPSAPML